MKSAVLAWEGFVSHVLVYGIRVFSGRPEQCRKWIVDEQGGNTEVTHASPSTQAQRVDSDR